MKRNKKCETKPKKNNICFKKEFSQYDLISLQLNGKSALLHLSIHLGLANSTFKDLNVQGFIVSECWVLGRYGVPGRAGQCWHQRWPGPAPAIRTPANTL